MSGGSFGYLHTRGPDDLGSVASSLKRMAEECEGYADRVAVLGKYDLEDLRKAGIAVGDYPGVLRARATRLRILAARIELDAELLKSHEALLHAVEWTVSSDSSPPSIATAKFPEVFEEKLATMKALRESVREVERSLKIAGRLLVDMKFKIPMSKQ